MPRRRKFEVGQRVIGRIEGPASFRERVGTIQHFIGNGEYGVQFDDGQFEYVMSTWIEQRPDSEPPKVHAT